MLYKFKPNYFIATLGGSIEFDAQGIFDTNTKSDEVIMKEIGAIKVVAKKTDKD